VVPLADENWAEAWRAHFTPRLVGRRLLILPPWETPAQNGRMVITIDPGRAFGTGHHGSTLAASSARSGDRARRPAADDRLGTGSGILAIAAARLGVRAVLAVDDDPDAVAAAMANVGPQPVADRIRCVLADAARFDEAPAPLVVANLLTAAHRRLGAQYARALLPGGTLLLGGILDGEGPDLAAALG
jgi:ribosomal protein L11 methyltransferase